MKGTASTPKSGGALANATVVTASTRDHGEIPTTHLEKWTNVTKASAQKRTA